MSTPNELIQEMEASLKTLIQEAYRELGIQVDKFLYDPKWQRENDKTIGRFRGTDGKTYQFVKDAEGIELFVEV
jgi:hypothetical protein